MTSRTAGLHHGLMDSLDTRVPSSGSLSGERSEEGEGADLRPRWFRERVLKHLVGATRPKWNKMMENTVNQYAIMNFCEEDDRRQILFYFNPSNALIASLVYPDVLKGNAMYFIKQSGVSGPLTYEEMSNHVYSGDVSPQPLEQLSMMMDEIFTPLLKNRHNHKQWPQVVAQDVLRHFHQVSGSVYVVKGLAQGKTLLPMPPDAEEDDDTSQDKSLVHQLESSVIEWTEQVQLVIQSSTSSLVVDGKPPHPLAELDFWRAKATNLECIHAQLRVEKMSKIGKILEITRSSYYRHFLNLEEDVYKALQEAHDVHKCLKPLRRYFEDMDSEMNTLKLTQAFKPLMHVVSLMWQESEYFSLAHLVTLLQETCTMLIDHLMEYEVDGDRLFKLEPPEALEHLQTALFALREFKSIFHQYKDEVCTDFPKRGWRVDDDGIFKQMDLFTGRLTDVLDLIESIVEFRKLEKVEIGGSRGKQLTAHVAGIYAEFDAAVNVFTIINYNVLDVTCREYDDDALAFRGKLLDLEVRVNTVISEGFSDCVSLTNAFKLLDSFQGLLNRDAIRHDFEQKYYSLIDMYSDDLDAVHKVFRDEKADPPLAANQPTVSGAVLWARTLRARIDAPYDKLLDLGCSVTDRDLMDSVEGQRVLTKHTELKAKLLEYEGGHHTSWGSGVDEVAVSKLDLPLLRRNADSRLLVVNFDPELVTLLREVKYLHGMELNIPPSAREIFDEAETFRHYISSLDAMVVRYNNIVTMIIKVEVPLVDGRLCDIDRSLEQGIESLTWKSSTIGSFIQSVSMAVNSLGDILDTMKGNVREIVAMGEAWCKHPIVERKDARRVLSIPDAHQHIRARSLEVELHGTKLAKLVEESRAVLGVEKDFQPWKDYVAHINGIVVDSFRDAVKISLNYFKQQMDSEYMAEHQLPALFEIQLRLEHHEPTFHPPLDNGDKKDDLKKIFAAVFDGIIGISKLVKRLDREHATLGVDGKSTGTYYDAIQTEVTAAKTELMANIDKAVKDCKHYLNDYDEFRNLWMLERDEYMEQFLLYGPLLMEMDDDLSSDLEESPPDLKDFKSQIEQQIGYATSLKTFHNSKPIFWLKVDCKPFKGAVNNIIQKWKYMFTQHLYNDVVNSLQGLENFITESNDGLNRKVEPGDYAALVECMSLLRDIRSRIDDTESMFVPLKAKIALLKEYGIEFPQEVLDKLNDLPQEWGVLKRKMYAVKDALAPLQQDEVDKIKIYRKEFSRQVKTFVDDFNKDAPFDWDVSLDLVYLIIDKWNVKCEEVEQHALDLNDQEDMFELTVVHYKDIEETRRTLRHLKALWDLISLVKYEFVCWERTLWTMIDTDQMESDGRQLARLLKQLPRDCKPWNAYQVCEQHINNTVRALRSIAELRSPAMRDRHWRQLMTKTGVFFDITDEVKLEDLLSLNLHKYDEIVRNIVDKALLELSMESQLKELDDTWRDMEFSFDVHHDTPLLKPMEELMETLEENMVSLQNMMTSKYVSYFLERITEWQTKLFTVDSVVHLWLEVQHDWMHLESIFKGSADIREQLPADSNRFDRIDREWRELMVEAELTPNAVKACSREGMLDSLHVLERELAVCSKALDEYLETKRLAFPRFYFISSDDLLDILAKGNNPQAVSVHLFKLFDNIKSLDFKEGTKTAVTMYSKEGEKVELTEPCDCEGRVEVWLNRLVDVMRATLRGILAQAVETYEEPLRVEWLFNYPAQITLTGSQIWFTSEVEQAFERLEEGYDNALKDYGKKQKGQLTTLVKLLQGKMDKGDRVKIMTICTIDTHSRDVIRNLVEDKVESSSAFGWQSQLRFRWDDERRDCFINICDAEFQYQYEYLGNASRLVITPLTDRCYITLTQSLRLMMGGAPAGPAGTGKTETTKDLGRALGIRVLVQNCSPQQTYLDMANIFKGLSQSGMWGCFDEFNRISIEVLSVVATQVKSILDALRGNKATFFLQDSTVKLCKTVGIFITMNPGYAGRTELPDNLKALFRPVSMVVPDLDRICEIMLIAEGFEAAEELSLKFTTLYALTKELLSKAAHYDWGLRAIKSVLVVAGQLKRDEPDIPEKWILMRALRDFNLPKIITEDVQIFKYLIDDLFVKISLDRKKDVAFEKALADTVVQRNLQKEDVFILKLVQLAEILEVRHSVFIIGPSGSGKTEVWKTLAATWTNLGRKCITKDVNPKAVDSKELFGYKNPVTKEPMEGLFSKIMRDLSKIPTDDPKWIVLDGDIDPNWIESLNTVMDDNKILTLPSNERIQLNSSMRLLFEIGNVKHATPATVSRAGILYINESDLGWAPFTQSWIENRGDSHLTVLFDRYLPPCLEKCKREFKHANPVSDFQMVETLCHMLDGLLVPDKVPPGSDREVFEIYFVFAVVWAVGGNLIQDSLNQHRVEFSKWFKGEFRTVKFPTTGTVFDYYVEKGKGSDSKLRKWAPWSDKVPEYIHDPEMPLSSVLVHTSETVRIRYWLDLFVRVGHPIMLVGNTGVGKTKLIQDMLVSLKSTNDSFMDCTVNFNYYTDSSMLQNIMETSPPLERKMGRDYGPPGTKRLIYFIDDITMPMLDEYETQGPHTLLRQHLDYGHWYDRAKWEIKNVKQCQYITCLNPKMGSFEINPRLQRHFAAFNVTFPKRDSLDFVYKAILSAHLAFGDGTDTGRFSLAVQKYAPKLVNATLDLHSRASTHFLPTAVKFHYQFNLRSLSHLFQGLLNASPSAIHDPADMCQLWVHEARRIYCDVLTTQGEMEEFKKMVDECVRKNFDDMRREDVFVTPLVYAHFAAGAGDTMYQKCESYESLNKVLLGALSEYNSMNPAMDLVLFQDAMEHVTRISRIIMNPSGSALLVGVGGSGKQSLARLAASINGFETFQMQVKSSYGPAELKQDLVKLYKKAGLRGDDVVFLLTDAQVTQEHFLIYINDLLASGSIPGLFTPEETEQVISTIRSEVKQAGIIDTKDNVWSYFINKVRQHLHVVLCFSPVGDTLRTRYRKFPALVNCTSIDWFHPWPKEALLSVAQHFLLDMDLGGVHEDVVKFIAFAHESVERASVKYHQVYRRYNYTTPKSFLELIKLYKSMLGEKANNIQAESDRLKLGLERLRGAAEQVTALHSKLEVQKEELEERKLEANELVAQLGKESEKVSRERQLAEEEEARTNIVAQEVAIKQADCDADLKQAEPALIRAEAALKTFTKRDLFDLKSFASPPSSVAKVIAAVMLLQSPEGRLKRDLSWKACRLYMSNLHQFYDSMAEFDKDNIPAENLIALKPYLKDPDWQSVETMKQKSVAAAGICEWVKNIYEYHKVYLVVQPKRDALADATANLEAARAKLSAMQQKLQHLDHMLKQTQEKFELANEKKIQMEREAEQTRVTIELANRLVTGLSSEGTRWNEEVDKLQELASTLVGDVLIAAGFISYIGAFNRPLRDELLTGAWLPWVVEHEIPLSKNYKPLKILSNDATVAQWNNDGLPTDRISLENATICCHCQRWPLLVDPQLQGVSWLKERKDLGKINVLKMDQDHMIDIVIRALQEGETVIIEGLREYIDPSLDPLIARNFINHGRSVKLADKVIDINPDFKLFLQTKLGNPHFKPELQAQTTLINFTVTEDGLEDQLLATVVNHERADLEDQRTTLIRALNEYEIRLKELESSLLQKLQEADGDFLSDTVLVENLENTKATSDDINKKKAAAIVTQENISNTRNAYRPVATRASLLYFLLNDLASIDHMYQFSLKAFVVVFVRAITNCVSAAEEKGSEDSDSEDSSPVDLEDPAAAAAAEHEQLLARVKLLIDEITFGTFTYAARGLFERHKLIFTTMMAFRIITHKGDMVQAELNYLIRGPLAPSGTSVTRLEWLSEQKWRALMALKQLPAFEKLSDDIEGSASRWKKWMEEQTPETTPMPQDWKSKTPFQKLLIVRALRPDRLINALVNFIAGHEALGPKYTEAVTFQLESTFKETSPETPIFFILSPGVDPVKNVEAFARTKGFTAENDMFRNVSLGQGQEERALECLDYAYKEGAWVILQNIHLMVKWLPVLEKKLDQLAAAGAHENFRVFLSGEPAESESGRVPIGILQSCIKVTNEPPSGMKANMIRALDNFDQDALEQCSKESEFHTILFTMCFFHAVVLERRKFGSQGWNRPYNFSTGDLTISADVLNNYLENNAKVPWEDLRYIFGEIMYGGHISDDWDRRLCKTYLDVYLRPQLLDDDMELVQGFSPPPHGSLESYYQYITENLPPDSPAMFGMNNNAETDFLTRQSDTLFKTIVNLQPELVVGAGAGTREDKVANIMKQIQSSLSQDEQYNMSELYTRTEDRREDPYVVVALQECDRMNVLVTEMKRSLNELSMGMQGDLMVSEAMETLSTALFADLVPDTWANLAYPSLKPLNLWFDDLLLRIRQLDKWSGDFRRPNVVWLSGLFNPQSFLTAIMQQTARKNKLDLDKMALQAEVTKKAVDDIYTARAEGAHITGLYLEGATWDTGAGQLADAKELYCKLPVVYVKAVTADKVEHRDVYECPLYKTKTRGPTYVWTFSLRTKQPASKWILAGTAILLSVE